MAHRIAEKVTPRPSLRVLHRGLAMVPDYGAMADTKTRRYHGLVFDPTLGPEDDFVHPVTGEGYRGNHGGFVKQVDLPVTIDAKSPHYAEYIRHLKDGDLWAADAETAAAAGVPFEPEFGGEHPGVTNGEECQAALKLHGEREKRGVEEAKKTEAKAKADAGKKSAPTAVVSVESGK